MFIPHFWKLSHGIEYFSFDEMIKAISNKLVYVHKDTTALGTTSESQAKLFVEAPVGDYFYLTHGNKGIYALGQFVGPANVFSDKGEGWLDRPFRLIKAAEHLSSYDDDKKWWAPNFRSTFALVPDHEHAQFEKNILSPFFGITLSDFGL